MKSEGRSTKAEIKTAKYAEYAKDRKSRDPFAYSAYFAVKIPVSCPRLCSASAFGFRPSGFVNFQ